MTSSRSPLTRAIRVRSIPLSAPGPLISNVERVSLESTDAQGRRSVNSRRLISTPYSLKTVLRRKTLTAQTVGMLSSTINIASSERSNPLVNGSSICRASRAIQMAPTTATGTARHRMSTERRRISRPSGICVVHPRSDASPPERPTVKPPEEDFLPPSPDILT